MPFISAYEPISELLKQHLAKYGELCNGNESNQWALWAVDHVRTIDAYVAKDNIIGYYYKYIHEKDFHRIYAIRPFEDTDLVEQRLFYGDDFPMGKIFMGAYLGVPFVKYIYNSSYSKPGKDQELAIKQLNEEFLVQVKRIVEEANLFYDEYLSTTEGVSKYIEYILNHSFYDFVFKRNVKVLYEKGFKRIVIDYSLPSINEIPSSIRISIFKEKNIAQTKLNRLYDEYLYLICLRTIAEAFTFDDQIKFDSICFNGYITMYNRATGTITTKCLMSICVSRDMFSTIDLRYVDPKECFKYLRGVSATKLYECTPITPIINNTDDKRFVNSRSIEISTGTNLAEMDWEDFEHLIRQVFEWEFSSNGSEVKVTQASRDGGVDAVVFDPDPIRGGKIIIQAKRYTNTVGVSAVRDLYGTLINEGANKGILITTSDYGTDSYQFAQGKPITLLNGGHLLYLLKKHGHKAYIDIKEARNNRR